MNSDLTKSSIICDYITLFIEDGNITNGVGEWIIPASAYYYQDRGTMAMLSLADGVCARGGTRATLVAFENGFNGTTAQVGTADPIKSDLAFLGIFQMVGNAAVENGLYNYHKTDPIKVLTPARPSKIRFHFFTDDKTEATFNGNNGCLILKFEYLSPEAEKEISHQTAYTPAFPVPNPF